MATITADTSTGLRGRFWLQGAPEEAIPGHLFLKVGSHPMLELDRPLISPMPRQVKKMSRRKLPDGGEVRSSSPVSRKELVRQSFTIHGTLDESAELVTLPSAFTTGWAMRGNGSQTHNLQAFYVLLGDHVDGADAVFTRISVRIRHLDAWADLPGFKIDQGSTSGSWTLAFEPPDVPSATLASGARISVAQVTGWKSPSPCGGHLKRSLWLNVQDIPPMTYRDLGRKIVMPLMNLLSFAVREECPLVEMRISAGPDHPWLTVRNDSMKAAAEDIIPRMRILLPMTEIGTKGIAAWLDSTPSLGRCPP